MSGYNEPKKEILALVDELGEASSGDIAALTYRDSKTASMALMRYHRQGLLYRYWDQGEYMYGLTDRGYERMEWLRDSYLQEKLSRIKRQRIR